MSAPFHRLTVQIHPLRILVLAITIILTLGGPSPAEPALTTGGSDETSENFTATGGWRILNMTPGCLPVGATLTADHLVISEVAPRGAGTGASSDSSEYFEIYNPTAAPVSLDDYYISDDRNYFRIVNGPYAIPAVVDFNLRFPPGSMIEPGEVVLIVKSELGFLSSFGGIGGISGFCSTKIFAMDNRVHPPTVFTPMIDAAGSSLGTSGVGGGDIAGPTGCLTNPSATNGEWIVLYRWNGVSDLVCDVDYASFGDGTISNNPKLDKTGVSIDGPDPGTDVSAYSSDTPATLQSNLGEFSLLAKPNTYQRVDGEVGEILSGGNGCQELPVGSVAGQVVADCPAAGTPLLGVSVDAFEIGTGDLAGTAVTNAGGGYQIDDLPAGSYIVTLVTPLGYTTTSGELPVTIVGGETAVGNFALECVTVTAAPRTIGYWKHQIGVATGGGGAAQVDAATLCAQLDLIAAHFGSNVINQVIVYEPPVSGECADKLLITRALLNLPGSVAMLDRAKQQLMSLLFNVAAGYIGQTSVISGDGATVSQAITYCDQVIDDPGGDYERAKTIADLINNGQVVPSGWIPLATPSIAYARGAGVAELRVLPNPSASARTIDFVLSEAGPVTLAIYDVVGRRIATIFEGVMPEGRQTVRWQGRSEADIRLVPGLYFARLSTATGTRSVSLIQTGQ